MGDWCRYGFCGCTRYGNCENLPASVKQEREKDKAKKKEQAALEWSTFQEREGEVDED